jgi:hypothetical protein
MVYWNGRQGLKGEDTAMINKKHVTASVILLVGLLMIAIGTVGAHDPELPTPAPIQDGEGGDVSLGFIPNYYEHIQPIMEAKCINCHIEGEIGYESFAMDYATDIIDAARDIELVTSTGYMPPWPPGDESPHFLYERSLTDEETTLIAAWVDAGAPAGDSANAVPAELTQPVPPIEPDLTLQLPEPYIPNDEYSDDYRCFMIDPGFTEDTYITSYDIIPDNGEAVHHVLLFTATPEQRAEAETKNGADGQAGWPCYGASGLTSSGSNAMTERFLPLLSGLDGFNGLSKLLMSEDGAAQIDAAIAADPDGELASVVSQLGGTDTLLLLMQRALDSTGGLVSIGSLGSWVPGNEPTHFPEGTGFLIPAGDFIVMQMHYYTSGSTEPDQSSVVLETATGDDIIPLGKMSVIAPVEIPCPPGTEGETCAREVAVAASHDNGMAIASDEMLAICGQTIDEYADIEGTNATTYCDFPVLTSGWIISVNNHMHHLGTHTRTTLNPDTPDEQILLDIPDWDFHWQGDYWFADPVWIEQGDTIRTTCTWDNSISRENPEPRYVVFGESTDDEMCLAGLTVLPAEAGDPPPVPYGTERASANQDDMSAMDHEHSDASMAHNYDEPLILGESDTIPEVFLSVQPDPLGGYMVRVQTFNFTFAPQNAGGEHRDGEGHAHLYVNGEKAVRIYGEWFHLDTLPTGNNTIMVTLNSNTHAPLHTNGEAIAAMVNIEVLE